jgi:hypothetical protein
MCLCMTMSFAQIAGLRPAKESHLCLEMRHLDVWWSTHSWRNGWAFQFTVCDLHIGVFFICRDTVIVDKVFSQTYSLLCKHLHLLYVARQQFMFMGLSI